MNAHERLSEDSLKAHLRIKGARERGSEGAGIRGFNSPIHDLSPSARPDVMDGSSSRLGGGR